MKDVQHGVSRRAFFQVATAAAAGVAMPSIIFRSALAAPGRPGANDRARIGVIGVGHRAWDLIRCMPSSAEIVALADCYGARLEAASWYYWNGKYGRHWSTYQDYRQMLDREKLDGVMVMTRAHQRVLPCIHAMQAGVDVYAEKPISLTIAESRALVQAAGKYERVVQVGTQCRSVELNRLACELIRNGGIGKIRKVLMVNHPGPLPLPVFPEQPIPPTLDWDAWNNQVLVPSFNHELLLSPFQWRPYDGYQVTNWVHGIDMVHCALGMDHTGPCEIWPDPNHHGEPNVAPVHLRYADGTVLSYELARGPNLGGIFLGEDCKLELNLNKVTTNPPDLLQELPKPDPVFDSPEPLVQSAAALSLAKPHLANWIDCIKTRQQPNGDIDAGHHAMVVCHLVNICRELRRRLRWDPDKEIFLGDDEANGLISRPRRKGYELPDLS